MNNVYIRRSLLLLLALAFMSAANGADGAGRDDIWIVKDVTVVPVDTDEVLPHRTVLIREGRVDRIVGSDTKLRIRGARTIDGQGKFLIPGLVDTHVHIANEGGIRDSGNPRVAGLSLGRERLYDRRVLMTLLKAGVTGAANLGGSQGSDDALLWLRDEISAGRIAGPRLFVGKRINGPHAEVALKRESVPASTVQRPTTPSDAIAAVRLAHRRGYDFIKPYQHFNRETYRAIVDESRRLGMVTTGHLPELGCPVCVDRRFFFEHPMDNIAHAEELARYGRQGDLSPRELELLAERVAEHGISVTPTLVTLKTIVHMYSNRDLPPVPQGWRELVDPVTALDWQPGSNRYVSAAFREQEGADLFPAGYDFARLLTRELWKRGVPLTVGTDAPLPGLVFGVSVHQEMSELRAIGLSPLEVLRAATINAYRLFDRKGGSGAVRPGERADLVLLDADPLSDIQNISRIHGVFAGGRWLPSDEIDAMLAELSRSDRAMSEQLNGSL